MAYAFGRLKARWSIFNQKNGFENWVHPDGDICMFCTAQFFVKKNSYIDEDLVQFQLNLIKQNEA
jgi:hypothetical protein